MNDTETLRRAATLIRELWTDAADDAARMRADGSGIPVGTLASTMVTVADWLGFEARMCERADANYPERAPQPADEHALAVANAYLQETP